MMMPAGPEAIVVTGLGIVCSIGSDTESFTEALREGRSGIGPSRDGGVGGAPFAAEIRNFDLDRTLAALTSLPEDLRRSARRAAFRSPLPIRVAVIAALPSLGKCAAAQGSSAVRRSRDWWWRGTTWSGDMPGTSLRDS